MTRQRIPQPETAGQSCEAGTRIARMEKEMEILRQREETYRALFEGSRDASFLLDKGRIIDCNHAALEMMGCRDKEELLGLLTGDLSPQRQPDGSSSFEKAAEIRARAFREGAHRFEWVFRKRNGIEFPAEVLLTAIPLGQTKVLHAVFRDISDRKKAEDELRRSQKELASIIDFLPDATWAIDREGKVTVWNKSAEDLTGIPASDMVGKGDYAYAVPFYGTRRPIMIDLIVNPDSGREGAYDNLKRVGNVIVGETRVSNLPGGERHLWGKAAVIVNHKGEADGAIETVRDITERETARESLRREEEKFRTLVEESPLGVLLLDAEGAYKYINPRFIQTFGYTLDDIPTGREWYVRAFPNPDDRMRAISAWVKDKGAPCTKEIPERIFTVMCKDGTEKVIHFRTMALETGDHIVLSEDITERKRLEEQLQRAQKMEAIGTLAGGIAHDFNNILGAIMGYTELAQEEIEEESPAQHDLRQVLHASHRAKELVEQILSFSRQSRTDRRSLRISSIVKEALKLLRASLPANIEIRQKIESATGTVLGNPTQVHQIIMNLCTNAAHAMRETGGILEVGVVDVDVDTEEAKRHSELDPGPYVRLTVSDTGHGMDGNILERIFDPYFTTKTLREGTGLGLAVVHGIVKSYGGMITVQSSPGEGAAFQILLPRIHTAEEEKEFTVETIPGGNERILFVDDEKSIAEIALQQLSGLGYDVTVRRDGLAALEVFRAYPDRFDLVVTDQSMPNMTGAELCREILKIRPEIPLVLCTGFSEVISEESARAIGVWKFVRKPIRKREIGHAIRCALDGTGKDS
ncbi:MAG: PAS domain S-box protein [Deltaproteobacteria bacterium]|nr:PAS domain S-box protein [Deltaproteobacteria bacterium]